MYRKPLYTIIITLFSLVAIYAQDSSTKKGLDFYEKKNYAEALKEFNNAIKSNPSDIEIYYYRANTFLAMEEYKKAIADYSTVINSTLTDLQF
ncbi:MAG: tetratricopeptide repeat protein [Bacteroidota bacterium]|nr:MAG: tetratricopeptide repeat protein [Bacteroidota bacterium]